MATIEVERATPADAAGIVHVLQAVVAERVHSAIERAWPLDQEARYLASLSPREAFHIARDPDGNIVGFQSLDLWSPLLPSMAHVGQLGTFLLPQWRGQGVGRQLWAATRAFAEQAGYEKLVIQVRASNTSAQRFYHYIGFRECGRLARQVRIDGVMDDEVLMELFLRSTDGVSTRRE